MLSILAAALPTILGIMGSAIPQLVGWLEKGQKYKHELKILELQMEAARQGLDGQVFIEGLKAAGREAEALREHDTAIPSHRYIDYLRASVRPVVTYTFFFAFIGFKALMTIAVFSEADPDLTNFQMARLATDTVWDDYTQALFGACIGFWFGSRDFWHRRKGN